MNTPRSVKKRKNTAEIQALRSASARCMNPHSPVHSDAGAAVFPSPPPAARASSTVSSLVTHRQVRQTNTNCQRYHKKGRSVPCVCAVGGQCVESPSLYYLAWRLDCLRNSPLVRRPLRQELASDCEASGRAAPT